MTLVYEGCADGPEHEARVKDALMMDRARATRLGESAVRASEMGVYAGPEREMVDWSHEVQTALDKRESIDPTQPLRTEGAAGDGCRVSVQNTTSLLAAYALVVAGQAPLVLNLANGVSPGGGFLHGSRAQEEALCRSSALYVTLRGDPMYERHRGRGDYESSDSAILSPDVPVFRTDDGTVLAAPWLCSFVTCAAPVAQRVGEPRSSLLMAARIDRVLDIATARGFRSLVLGAWGCGAFGNDPVLTAESFHRALKERSEFFDVVVFAISDWSPARKFLGPFRDELSR